MLINVQLDLILLQNIEDNLFQVNDLQTFANHFLMKLVDQVFDTISAELLSIILIFSPMILNNVDDVMLNYVVD